MFVQNLRILQKFATLAASGGLFFNVKRICCTDLQNVIFLTQRDFLAENVYPKKCVIFDNIKSAAMQRI